MACFCLAGFGISASLPFFWNLPTAWLGPTAAADGIAVINYIGNISGYAAPQLIGLLRDVIDSYEVPMTAAGLLCWLPRPACRCPACRDPAATGQGSKMTEAKRP